MFIYTQQSGNERKCYIALQSKLNSNALCSVSMCLQWKSRAKLPGQQYMGGIADIDSGDKSSIDSWCHGGSDVFEHAAITLNYSVDLPWWDSTSSLVPSRGLVKASPCGLELWVISQCLTAPSLCKVHHPQTGTLLTAMPSPAKSQKEILQLFSQLLWQGNPLSCRDWKLHMVPDAILGALNQGLDTLACNIYKAELWKK